MSNTIYTIGHSNITAQEFFERLKEYQITALVDIRSTPYSQFASQFNRELIEQACQKNGFFYFFFGDSLGGKPAGSPTIGKGKKVDYDYLSRQDNYLSGISRLMHLTDTHRICLMCSEGQPDKCHRKLLVGQSLEKEGVHVLHILPDRKAVDSNELALMKSKGQLVLF
ncbi:MAG: DUF488 domain-containing protein [Pseudomonadota bacterium]